MKRCPQCGAVVNLQAKFCENCAHAFRTDFVNRTQVISPQPPAPREFEPGYPIVALMMALFSIVVAYFEPALAFIIALGALVFSGVKLRGVSAWAVVLSLLVIVAVAIMEGYEAGQHRARVQFYTPPVHTSPSSDFPALPPMR